jgi:hypothetical protein
MLQLVRKAADDGRYETFKSTTEFDGPHHRKTARIRPGVKPGLAKPRGIYSGPSAFAGAALYCRSASD